MPGNVIISGIQGGLRVQDVRSDGGDVVISNITAANGKAATSKASPSVELPEGYHFDPATNRLHLPDTAMYTGMSIGVGPGTRVRNGPVSVDGYQLTIDGKTFQLKPDDHASAATPAAAPALEPAPHKASSLAAQLRSASFDSQRQKVLEQVLGTGSVPPVDEWSAIIAAHSFDSGKLAALTALINAMPDVSVPGSIAAAITASMSWDSGAKQAKTALEDRVL